MAAQVTEADAIADADGEWAMAAGEHFAESRGDHRVGGGDIAVIETDHFGGGRGRSGLGAIPIAGAGLVGDGVSEANENGLRILDDP